MTDIEKSDALEAMTKTPGWDIYVNDVVGTMEDLNRGKYSSELKKLKDTPRDAAYNIRRGFLRGLDFATSCVWNQIDEWRGVQRMVEDKQEEVPTIPV